MFGRSCYICKYSISILLDNIAYIGFTDERFNQTFTVMEKSPERPPFQETFQDWKTLLLQTNAFRSHHALTKNRV